MHILKKSTLLEFAKKHPDAKNAILSWYRAVEEISVGNVFELRKIFPGADPVLHYTVFNIRGNRYRLVTVIRYDRQRVYIVDFLTHAEYDKNRWKRRTWKKYPPHGQ